MESLFKQKLLGLRNPAKPQTFAEALMGDVTWYKSKTPNQNLPHKSDAGYSEQKQVLESLERFAVEKTNEASQKILKVHGGEVVVKNAPDWSVGESFKSLSALEAEIKLDSKFKEILLKEKVPGTIKVIFITEKLRPWEEVLPELKEGLTNELLAGFVLKTAELFERMILAMKLNPDEVMIYPIEGIDGADYSDDVTKISQYFRPEVVVTLGAKATQKVLNSKDRLTVVHGQFFPRKLSETHSLQIVPLFHPSVIETNLNMKKTTWTDMQKIMKFLKKIP